MLDSDIRHLIFEDEQKQKAIKNGYAVVVGTRGLDSEKGYRIECEVVIPGNEFDNIRETLIESGVIDDSIPVQYKTFDGLMYGEKVPSEDNLSWVCKPGIFPDTNEDGEDTGRELRDQLRLHSLVSTQSSAGIFDDITKQEFETLGHQWQKAGYSHEGSWPSYEGQVWPRHSFFYDGCPWCMARHKKIGGSGDPDAKYGYVAKQTIKSRLNSGEIGWACGDPVRPPFLDRPKTRKMYGRQGQGAAETPEWLQYQYNEIVYIVLNQYKQDIVEAIVDRLGLDDTPNQVLGGYSVKELVLGPQNQESIYENLSFKIPRNAYTKVFTGAPPHMQHKSLEPPGKLNFGKFYVYYVEAVLRMEMALDYNPGEFDSAGNIIKPAKPVKFSKDEQQNNPWSTANKPIFPPASAIFHQITNAVSRAIRSGALDKTVPETGHTYKSSTGHTYNVIKVPTGIKGLNFLIDPFMPTKQSEIDRRPEYHGDKQLPTEKIGQNVHGIHKSELYGYFGQMGKIVYDDLDFYFREKFDLTIVPWDPVKPYPIDYEGNIYFIPDDDLLVVNITGYDEIVDIGPNNYEKFIYKIPGRIKSTPEDGEGYYTILVNSGSCPKCLADHKIATEKLGSIRKGTDKYKRKLIEIQRIALLHGQQHEEKFPSANVIGVESAAPMDDEYISHIKKNSKLNQDLNTYKIFSAAWIALNIQRIVDRGEMVIHPFKSGEVIAPEELLQALSMKINKDDKKDKTKRKKSKYDLSVLHPDIIQMDKEYPGLQSDLKDKLKPVGTIKDPVTVEFLAGEKSSADVRSRAFEMSFDDSQSMLNFYPGLFRVMSDRFGASQDMEYDSDDIVVIKMFTDSDTDKSPEERDGYDTTMAAKEAGKLAADNHGIIKRKVADGTAAGRIKEVKNDLLSYFRNYDLRLLNDLKIEDGKVDVSSLTWKDKVAIPINNASVSVSPSDPVSVAKYDEWLTKRKYVDADLYMMVVPHSIVKKQLGLDPDSELSKVREVATLNYDIGNAPRDAEDILDIKKLMDDLSKSLDDKFDDLDDEELMPDESYSEVDQYSGENVEQLVNLDDDDDDDELDDSVVEIDQNELNSAFGFEEDDVEPEELDLLNMDDDDEDYDEDDVEPEELDFSNMTDDENEDVDIDQDFLLDLDEFGFE